MRIPHRSWIFDMDGTLTLSAHDFDAFKKANGLEPDRPVLEQIDRLPPNQAAELRRALVDWEAEIADRSQAAPDALALLRVLHARGDRMGILTRNTRELALRTLSAAGLMRFFPPETILGRNCARPKPHPQGILQILSIWRVPPTEAVMVGDYVFDLDAGRAASLFTIYIDRQGSQLWQDHADLRIERLDHLLDGN
jgi:HAD superfamily hydrolase (TIGR01509 family)